MAGTYTEITQIDAPGQAAAGSTVDVAVAIGNLYNYAAIHVACVAVLDSEDRFIDWEDAVIEEGGAHWFSGSFQMPSEAVTVNVYSYYEDENGYWQPDDEASKDVAVEEEEYGFNLETPSVRIA